MKKTVAFLLLICLSTCAIFAQDVDASASSDSTTVLSPAALREQYKQVSLQVDSLTANLNECRRNYDSNPGKYGDMIVALEAKLFDATKKQSQLQKQIAALPDDGQGRVQATKSNSKFTGRNLIDSPFFKDNLSKSDLAFLKNSSPVTSSMSEAKELLDNMYDSLKVMKESYSKADDQQIVDKLLLKSEQLQKSISDFDTELSNTWIKYYNVKIDNYLVLLDKVNNISRSDLERIDLLSRQAQSSVDPESTLTPCLSNVKAQNMLISAYEMIMAEKLGYTMALDSLKKVSERIQEDSLLLYPPISFPYRSVATYGNISLGGTYSYQSPSDIPVVKIPSSGLYYTIQLYFSQYPVKQLSTFKGATPLMFLSSGGYNRYLAGGFRTYSDAARNLSAMFRAGFKAPKILVWLDGKLTTIDKAKAYEASSAGAGYIIEVKSSKSSTPSVIKDVLSVHANGKTWTNAQAGDKTIYRIMKFESKEEAEVIAQIIRTKDSSLEISVVDNSSSSSDDDDE